MSNIKGIILGITAALAAVGCESRPSAVYQAAPEQSDSEVVISNASKGGDLFAMPQSKIVVALATSAPKAPAPVPAPAPAPAAKAAAASPSGGTSKTSTSVSTTVTIDGQDYSVSVAPVEGTMKYLLHSSNDFWSTTQVNITKIPNTDIPVSVSSQFTDNTKTRIDQAAGIVTGVISVAAMLAAANNKQLECQQKPIKLMPFTLVVSGEVKDPQPIEGQDCWQYQITYASPLPGAGAVSWTRLNKDLGTPVGYFPVPACRDIQLNLVGYKLPVAAGTPATQSVIARISMRIADPEFVRLAPLPTKGQISMHPVCGADVTDSGTDRFGGYLDDVNEVLKQAKAIEDAQPKKPAPPAAPAKKN